MSVNALKAALTSASNPRLAIVSQTLFIDLFTAGELRLHPVDIYVPSDAQFKEPIDALIRAYGVDPNAPAKFSIYEMVNFPGVFVNQDVQHGLLLQATGAGSFVVK